MPHYAPGVYPVLNKYFEEVQVQEVKEKQRTALFCFNPLRTCVQRSPYQPNRRPLHRHPGMRTTQGTIPKKGVLAKA